MRATTLRRSLIAACLAASPALLLAPGCRATPRGDPVPDIPLGQSTASGGDPSRPLVDATDIPPPGPGMPISTPGRGPIAIAPGAGAAGDTATSTSAPTTTMPDTIAPRTIAPGDVDATVESRGQPTAPVIVAPAPPTPAAPATGAATAGGGTRPATGTRPGAGAGATGTGDGSTGTGATGTPAPPPSTPGGPGR